MIASVAPESQARVEASFIRAFIICISVLGYPGLLVFVLFSFFWFERRHYE
jgi:hypothetical protein